MRGGSVYVHGFHVCAEHLSNGWNFQRRDGRLYYLGS
jgi:hypothetical protein